MDPARRLATLKGADPATSDPIAWYAETHGAGAGYAELLDGMAHTPADRRNLLIHTSSRTTTSARRGLKTPTAAHRAVAQLAARLRPRHRPDELRPLRCHHRDPNFCGRRLSARRGWRAAGRNRRRRRGRRSNTPLVHSRCTVFKVHSDYLSVTRHPQYRGRARALRSADR